MMPKPTPPPAQKNGENAPLPKGWQHVKLKEVCELNPRRPAILRSDNALTTFIPMPAVAESGAGITRPALRPFREVRKGYTYFAEGDVLFAKITPCMQNGKHAIAKNLTDGIGFGSTEFHVLRPGPRITAEWIHAFLIQPSLLDEAQAFFTGAVGQQRVPADYLAEIEIPLPPLSEQRRIAARLREQLAEVAQARVAINEKLVALDHLPAALLREAFSGRL